MEFDVGVEEDSVEASYEGPVVETLEEVILKCTGDGGEPLYLTFPITGRLDPATPPLEDVRPGLLKIMAVAIDIAELPRKQKRRFMVMRLK